MPLLISLKFFIFYFFISTFIFFPSNILAQNQHIEEILSQKQIEVPLKQALGDEAYTQAMNSGKYNYVGNSKCRLCHREFFIGRKHDLHDFTIQKLAKSKNEKNPRCLVCHTTGYGVDDGFVSMETTPRLANVQCEGCHGPGSLHIKLAKEKMKLKSNINVRGFLVGTDHPKRLKKICTSCHTSQKNNSYNNLQEAYDSYRYANPNMKNR